MVGSFLVDSCTINEPSDIAFDETLGTDTETAGAEVYSGACQVRPVGGDLVVGAGEGEVSLGDFIVRLPWDTTGIETDQLVTVNASSDPYLTGRRLRVKRVLGGTDSASRNLLCEDPQTVTEEAEVLGS